MEVIFLKNLTILNPDSDWFGKIGDYRWESGGLTEQKEFSPDERIISDAYILPGLIDFWCFTGEPGFEQRETLASLQEAAKYGGMGTLFILPSTSPPLGSKEVISGFLQKTKESDIQVIPHAALSKEGTSEDLNELIDVAQTGVKIFTDGTCASGSDEFYIRALQYIKKFSGVLSVHANDEQNLSQTLVNQSPLSASLGLPGQDRWHEIKRIQTLLELLKYTESRLHIANVSCKESIELIEDAKQKGLNITASVAALNLIFTEQSLIHFDEVYKVNPPLREEMDRKALIQALKKGALDWVNTNHRPTTLEEKKQEFEYAEFGASMLQVAWPALLTHGIFTFPEIVEIGYQRPRDYLTKLGYEIKPSSILWIPKYMRLTPEEQLSKSAQTPFMNNEFLFKPQRLV